MSNPLLSPNLKGIKGFLLDVDGTLIDSNDAHARELLEFLSGKNYTLVIATSASSKDLKALLKQTGLSGFKERRLAGQVLKPWLSLVAGGCPRL